MTPVGIIISTILLTRSLCVQAEIRDILIGASQCIQHESFSPELEKDNIKKMTETESKDSSTKPKRRAKHVPIISGSFQLLSGTFGLAAKSFKISGDTAAGVLGSSLRLIGAVVKTTGSRLDSMGNSIHPPLQEDKVSKKYDYFPSSIPRNTLFSQSQNPKRRILYESRSAAAKSIQFLGSVVQEIGDVFAITGAATESLGSSLASIAEESLRVGETVANSLAKLSFQSLDRSISPRRHRRTLIRSHRQPLESLDDPIISYNDEESLKDSYERAETTSNKGTDPLAADDQFSLFESWFSMLDFLSKDTDGIPSQAPELFFALVLCYFATIYFMKSRSYEISHTIKVKQEIVYPSTRWLCFRCMTKMVIFPIKVFLFLFHFIFHLLFHRYTLLLLVYALIWIQLCHMSQIRSQSIYHKAEIHGYRLALNSLQSSKHGIKESAIWWNTLIQQIWRVPLKKCPRYPEFVLKGIPGCRNDMLQNSYPRPLQNNDEISTSEDPIYYGGLEPYLSWILGTAGEIPPTIRHVEILHQDSFRTEFLLDWELDLHDLNIILDLQLSSLEFARLPTTQIAIGSLIAHSQKVKIVATSLAEPPFFSSVKISLVHPLDCNIRISSVGEESGLQGLNLGSIPIIREWIQGVIRDISSAYVEPKYISINLKKMFQRPSISELVSLLKENNQRTKHVIKENPIEEDTASTPDVTISPPFRRLSLLAAKTPAAKLAMEKWRKEAMADHARDL